MPILKAFDSGSSCSKFSTSHEYIHNMAMKLYRLVEQYRDLDESEKDFSYHSFLREYVELWELAYTLYIAKPDISLNHKLRKEALTYFNTHVVTDTPVIEIVNTTPDLLERFYYLD